MMDEIKFCKICSIEINKALVYDHIISKEHRDFEDYLIVKGKTYCELCANYIKNNEWRYHKLSEKHSQIEEKKYCGFCNLNYHNLPHNNKRDNRDRGFYHRQSGFHKKNQEIFGFYLP